jgi:hypothetical protein
MVVKVYALSKIKVQKFNKSHVCWCFCTQVTCIHDWTNWNQRFQFLNQRFKMLMVQSYMSHKYHEKTGENLLNTSFYGSCRTWRRLSLHPWHPRFHCLPSGIHRVTILIAASAHSLLGTRVQLRPTGFVTVTILNPTCMISTSFFVRPIPKNVSWPLATNVLVHYDKEVTKSVLRIIEKLSSLPYKICTLQVGC